MEVLSGLALSDPDNYREEVSKDRKQFKKILSAVKRFTGRINKIKNVNNSNRYARVKNEIKSNINFI